MKLTYDPRYNIAYLQLRTQEEQLESVRVSDDVILDLAPDGSLHGIELLNAARQLEAGGSSSLVVVNEALGQSAEMKVPI